MKKGQGSGVIFILFIISISALFISFLDTPIGSSIDELCSTNGKILKRTSGVWECADDATGGSGSGDVVNGSSDTYTFENLRIVEQIQSNNDPTTSLDLNEGANILFRMNDWLMWQISAEQDFGGDPYYRMAFNTQGRNFSFQIYGEPIGSGTDFLINQSGEIFGSSYSSDGTGKVLCVKSSGSIGTCSSTVDGSGVCTCG